jgi:hypothetical protein
VAKGTHHRPAVECGQPGHQRITKRLARLKETKNFLRETPRAPAASTKGISGNGGGSNAEVVTASTPFFSTQPVSRFANRLGR